MLLFAVKKRRVIQRPNYNESDENFSQVIVTFFCRYSLSNFSAMLLHFYIFFYHEIVN